MVLLVLFAEPLPRTEAELESWAGLELLSAVPLARVAEDVSEPDSAPKTKMGPAPGV